MRLIFLLLTLFVVTSASAFEQFYFVGDSLSDAGNNTELCQIDGVGGACTNQPRIVWGQFLAQRFNTQVSNLAAGQNGTDYAYAGAATNEGGDNGISVNEQVSMMINDQGGRLNPNAVYSIWAGGNNLLHLIEKNRFFTTNDQLLATAQQASGDIRNDVLRMHSAGARIIIVGNLPDLTNTPVASVISQSIKDRVKKYGIDEINNGVRNGVNSLPFDVIQLDYTALFDDIFANPTAYGFTDIVSDCDPSTSCKGKLFTFYIHPTVQGHQLIADYVYSVLTAPMFYANLANLALSSLSSVDNSVEPQLMPFIKYNPRHNSYVFASGNARPYQRLSRSNEQSLWQFTNASGTVGFSHFINPTLEIGGAFTHGYTHVNEAQPMGQANIDSNILSFFTSYLQRNYYIYGIVNGGWLNLRDIDRHFMLGPRSNDARGETNGSLVGITANSGWFIIKKPHLRSGPFASINVSHVDIEGYSETGAPNGANITYNDQKNNSVVSGLGWRLDFDKLINRTLLTTTLFLSANRQWVGGERDIYFHVTSLAGSHGFIPVTNFRSNFVTAGVNLSDQFKNGIIVTLGYNASMGSYDLFAQNINAALSVPLG